jgi:DNA-binding GntR family transcriptional regulator
LEHFPRLLRAPSTEPLTLEEHAAILEAIAKRDPAGAQAALTRHLQRLHPRYEDSVSA